MKSVFLGLTLFFCVSQAFGDEEFLGKSVETGSAGAPFCLEKDQLQEYLMAILQKDKQWQGSLKSCMFLKGGIKVAVIEEYEGSEIGHVVKARVFGPAGSVVAYTLSLGLAEKK